MGALHINLALETFLGQAIVTYPLSTVHMMHMSLNFSASNQRNMANDERFSHRAKPKKIKFVWGQDKMIEC